MVRGTCAAKYHRGRFIVQDGFEVLHNGLDGVGPEIIIVSRIFVTEKLNVEQSVVYQALALCEAVFEELSLGSVLAGDTGALFEVEFALGDAIGDGDGNGTGIGDVGLSDPVEPDDSEPRDRVKGEEPRPGGGKIVRGGHYKGVQLDRNHGRSFEFKSLPLCSAIAAPPAGITNEPPGSER